MFLLENMGEAVPCLFCKYWYLWQIDRENAPFLTLTTHSNLQDFGEVVLKENRGPK